MVVHELFEEKHLREKILLLILVGNELPIYNNAKVDPIRLSFFSTSL